MAGLVVGARCVRGPDWKWGDQDGGPGHVGTVVLLGHSGHPYCLPGTVEVIWDNGTKQNYRVGFSNCFDLRLLDNGPCGVFHSSARCSNCGVNGIPGIRWSCCQCFSYDLCSRCYNLRFHDLTHEFIRRIDLTDPGVKVGSRTAATPTEIHGTFRGAVVIRGQDWTWDDQDGGAGAQGRVVSVSNWQEQSANSVVSVLWPNKRNDLYRMGHKGKVDLKCLLPASGGYVYCSHLPLLGRTQDMPSSIFAVGQIVMVSVDLETLKQMQQGHGEYNERMREVLGKRGKVHRITEKGDVRVQYPGHPPQDHRWAINPAALTILASYSVGDIVTVTHDRSVLEKFHNNPGALESILGCSGKVTLVHSDVNVMVDFGGGRVSSLHTGILVSPRKDAGLANSQHQQVIRSAATGDLMAVESYLNGGVIDYTSLLIGLHKAVGNGHHPVVMAILRARPAIINDKLQEKTPLMIAAHEGHSGLVSSLVQCGADPNVFDGQGDSPLHYAVLTASTDVVLTLVDKGADVNMANNKKQTPLHLAVISKNLAVISALIKVGANVNRQDGNGDTPLHISLLMDSSPVFELLLPQSDLLICNNAGLNILHMAAELGRVAAIRLLLRRDPSMVNIVTREGSSALHSAARKSKEALRLLVQYPQCDINIQDREGKTALHYSSAQMDLQSVVLLLANRADPHLVDREGNTPAHLAVRTNVALLCAAVGDEESTGLPDACDLEDVFTRPQMENLRTLQLTGSQILLVGVLSVLLKHASGELTTNVEGRTVLDMIESQDLKTFLSEYWRAAGAAGGTQEHEYAEIAEPVPLPLGECRVCSESGLLVTFYPCQHQLVCSLCSSRIKKCLQCQAPVERKAAEAPAQVSEEEANRLRSLELKVQDLEDQFLCSICMERKRNVAFLCGHGACLQCTEGLETCHMCRTAIERKIPLY